MITLGRFNHLYEAVNIMGRFYLGMEFTNGNYYLADIIEIALVAEDSGNTFHSYIRIHYSIPKRVKELMNITDKTLATMVAALRIW